MRHALNLDDLDVESFTTVQAAPEPGTAQEFCPTFCFTQCNTACSCPVTK